MVKCLTFCVSCKSPLVIHRKPYNLPYKSHTVCHTKKDESHTKSCTEWQKSHTVPYEKPYCMAKKPYAAIQIAVQNGKKAIQCHTNSHTVQQKSHTVAIQKAVQYSKNAIHQKRQKMRREENGKIKKNIQTFRTSSQHG